MSIMCTSIHNIKLSRTNSFFSLFNPLRPHLPNLPKTLTLTLEMVTQSGPAKRPVCPSCSKPTRICLCIRFTTPKIQNSVAITILQHSLEKKHPLNSTRIASLGLRNVDVISVSDVNFHCGFSIRLLDPGPDMSSVNSGEEKSDPLEFQDSILKSGCGKDFKFRGLEKYPDEKMNDFDGELSEKYDLGSGKMGEYCMANDDLGASLDVNLCDKGSLVEKMDGFIDIGRQSSEKCDAESVKMGENCMVNDVLGTSLDVRLCEKECLAGENDVEVGCSRHNLDEAMVGSKVAKPYFDTNAGISRGFEGAAVAFAIEKYGVISSFCHRWTALGQRQNPNIEKLLHCRQAMDDLAKGFAVKKLQRKQLNGGIEYEECEEFEIFVPRGSVLLFPSEEAVGIEDIDFEVKNLIVLDGTWAKAKRMYNENPWLKVLPHLKLDIDKLSLYGEVRHQPKAGFLSTIESIVYALKALGDGHSEGLDGLLDVFDSMVGDQRRCKDERLSKAPRLSLD